MKTHSTNYFNTFIQVADDCPAAVAQTPQAKKGQSTIAQMQYQIVENKPYQFTSDDVLFDVYANKNNLNSEALEQARKDFFSKGHPCFRTSPLAKRFGFGIHANSEGKIAIYAIETKEYEQFLKNPEIKKVKAMRNSKK